MECMSHAGRRLFFTLYLFIAFYMLCSAGPLGAVYAQAQAAAGQTVTLQAAPDQQSGSAGTDKTVSVTTLKTVESLKDRPDLKGITTEEIAKGKDLLEKKEAEEKKPPETGTPERGGETSSKVGGPVSLFDRYRMVGPYQDISTALMPFGYKFFLDALAGPSTPRTNIPVMSNYIIGTGDEIKILFWGRVNAQYSLIVDRDGNITIPQIGPLQVAGMGFSEMKSYLAEQANRIVGASMNVTMGTLKSIQVFVLGDVRKPGSYAVDSFSTITSAIIDAGGPSEIGSLRNIELKRNNETFTALDFYDFLLKGNKTQDRILQSGDVIFVPTVGPMVGIAGNVKRPATYELKNENDLLSLIEMAGGIIPTAYTQQIQVERIQKNERHIVMDIDDKNLTESGDVLLQDGDLVKVFSIVDKDVNVVFLNGNVKRPGKYEYKPGMRIRDLIKDTADLLQETHFEYALIKRLVPPDLREELIPFNLGKLLFDNDAESNIELSSQDRIYIFSIWSFRDKPSIAVEGEVRSPGRSAFAENTRVRDALLNAGGLTKNAYLRKGELIRTDNKREFRTIYFNVARAMDNDPEENLFLRDEDRIIIHSMWEEKWKESVSISGEVKDQKTYDLTEAMTVSDLIFKAGGLTRNTYMNDTELYRTDWKTKEVTLQNIDLQKALAGDPMYNVKLKDLDRLVVHSTWEQVYKKSVSIAGEVTNPGTYQYTENMTVRDLVFASGNVLESAYLGEAEISSQVIKDGRSARIEHAKINLKKALDNDPSHNLPLKPYDRLFVKRIPDWRREIFVNLSGEIIFPGNYILKKGETLSSVIERAGGYSENAYLRGAVFVREDVRKLQQQSLDEMITGLEREILAESSSQVSTALSTEEVEARKAELQSKQKFIESLKGLKATGRMSIILAHLRLLKGSKYDIELKDGDSLYVPMKSSAVNVIGSVMSRGSFIYSEDMDYKDYVEMSGGYTRFADKDNVYVLKVDGTARKLLTGRINWNTSKDRWETAGFSEDVNEIEPGDTIIVPEKLDRIAWLRETKDLTQILYQIAVTAGVAIVLF